METTAERRRVSFLDTPLTELVSIDWEVVLYSLFILVAVVTRFWNLGARAQHHDESMHAYYSWELYRGKGFVHNPLLHGPFLYEFTALIYFLFGASDYTSRVGPAIFGVALVVLPYFLRKWLGRKGALAASGMLAISPSFLYFSRFIRMDAFAAGWTMLAVVALFKYLDRQRDLWLYVLVAAFSFLFSTKEVAFIHAFIFGTFLALLLARYVLREGRRTLDELRGTATFDLVIVLGTLLLPLTGAFLIQLVGWDPLDYSSSGMMRSSVILLILAAISIAMGFWWDRRRWSVAAAVYYGIFFFLHTTFLTNMQGFATGLVGSLGYWLSQQGVRRGTQPWYYYLILLPLYEFLPALLTILGSIFVLRGGSAEERERLRTGESSLPLRRVFDLFLVYWFVLAMLVYGWAGEKMPWLVLHMALPSILLGARYLGHFLEDTDWDAIGERGGMWFALLLPALGLVLYSFFAVRPSGGKTIEDLNRTMQWIASGILSVALVYGAYRVLRRLGARQAVRVSFMTLLIFLTVLTMRTAWVASYVHGDIAKDMLIYTQTSPDVTGVMEEIRNLSERLVGDKNLRVAYDNETSWPFTWYLRDYDNAQYFGEEPSGTLSNPVILVGTVNEQKVKPHINTVQYVRRKYALRWWFPEAYKRPAEWIRIILPDEKANAWLAGNADPTFWDAARLTLTSEGLRNVAHFILYREGIPEPLGSTDFVMYVRKDVVSDLWQYRSQAVATEPELLQDEYLEKYKEEVGPMAIWGSDQLSRPKDVAVGPEGNLYVADAGNHVVRKFSPQGRVLSTIGGPGVGPGQFNPDQGDNPWGVAVDQEGNVYVADTWGHRIQKFDAAGNFVQQWGTFVDSGGTAEGNPGQFWGPRDIAVDATGNIYVTDTGNKRVQQFSPDGEFLTQWGGVGAGLGKFDEPVGIAISEKTGDIFVADTWNQRIQRFDGNHQPITQWAIQGWEDRGVNNKPYLALDSQDNVYVTDPANYRVLKFDDEGNLLAIWGRFGTEKGAFDLPTALAVGPEGRVYVTDSLNHRVQIFPSVN